LERCRKLLDSKPAMPATGAATGMVPVLSPRQRSSQTWQQQQHGMGPLTGLGSKATCDSGGSSSSSSSTGTWRLRLVRVAGAVGAGVDDVLGPPGTLLSAAACCWSWQRPVFNE
jgi:hypothetical protein